MTFGEKLAKLRKENNYTQEQLADKLDVSRQSVSKWESDVAYPETDKLIKLSKLFHCSIDYLLDNQTTEKATTEEPSNNPPKNVTETDNSIPFSIWLKRVIPEIKSAKTVWETYKTALLIRFGARKARTYPAGEGKNVQSCRGRRPRRPVPGGCKIF